MSAKKSFCRALNGFRNGQSQSQMRFVLRQSRAFFADLEPSIPLLPLNVSINILPGDPCDGALPGCLPGVFGTVDVTQQPSAGNGFTTIVEFDDPGGGSRIYRVELIFENAFPDFRSDFNRDLIVDEQYLDVWNQNYGSTEAMHDMGDADGDGDVDGCDFLVWQRESGVDSLASVTIPEPSTLILCSLLTFTALALARCRVRRR